MKKRLYSREVIFSLKSLIKFFLHLLWKKLTLAVTFEFTNKLTPI